MSLLYEHSTTKRNRTFLKESDTSAYYKRASILLNAMSKLTAHKEELSRKTLAFLSEKFPETLHSSHNQQAYLKDINTLIDVIVYSLSVDNLTITNDISTGLHELFNSLNIPIQGLNMALIFLKENNNLNSEESKEVNQYIDYLLESIN